MKAVIRIRQDPHYRREAFEQGLQRAGYQVVTSGRPESKRDWLIIWNRKPSDEREAHDWEEAGGTVLVAENGYCGRDAEGRQNYALSAHAHNGAGWFPVGNEDRFAALNLTPAPWREQGEHILICAQRGIGSMQMRSPDGWHQSTNGRLSKITKRPIRVRLHPGNKVPAVPLETDLSGAWACAIWSSGSGVKALLAGVPVFYSAPHWICERAAKRELGEIETPLCDDERRLEALRYMAWGQHFVDELASGEPFIRFRDRIEEAPKWR